MPRRYTVSIHFLIREHTNWCKMLKFILLVCGITLFVATTHSLEIPKEFEDIAKKAHPKCVAESGANEESITKAAAGEFDDDEKFKCYLKCILEEFHMIKDEAIDFDAMSSLLPESIKEPGEKVIENCRATTGTDLCDLSFNFQKCFYKVVPEAFFIV